MLPKGSTYLTVEEYLAMEERAAIRHEYVDGQIFAMTGVTRRHNAISSNLLAILHSHLRGSGCNVYMSDVKVRVEATNSFYYPDLMVSCAGRNDQSVVIDKPVLIVEVLSRRTRAIDRREKVIAYRQIPSLTEYLIIYQSRQRAEMHRKNQSGSFDVFEFAKGDELVLQSANKLSVSLADIYENVDLDQGTDLQVRERTADWDKDAQEDQLYEDELY